MLSIQSKQRVAAVVCLAVALGATGWAAEQQDGPSPARFEKAIQTFEKRDSESPPAKGGILFLGSSSIRMWDVEKYFPDLPVVNRGFGGSHISDSIAFASRICLPYRPKTIVFYAGDNDVQGGKSPERVFDDYKAFVGIVRKALPETRILYLAIKPSIARWDKVEKMRDANARIREYSESDKRLGYIDIDTPMLSADGKPRSELFIKDGLHLSDAGYELWSALVLQRLEEPVAMEEGKLAVATCQFPVSADISENAHWIRRQMSAARLQHADVVHFPECALSGYAGTDYKTMDEFNWDTQKKELESILRLAKELHVWVVLGATHRLSGDNKPHNSLYVINDSGKIIDRYDKRFCTKGDLKHFSPGDHFVTFEINGVKCGCLICYDIRFPELYRQYQKDGVRLMFHSFYNARQKEGSIHPKIMPPTAQARAATNNMFLSVNNSCAQRSWQSIFVTPDGLIEKQLELDEPGVMVNLVDTSRDYYDASEPFRADAINGKWNSGETVEDPRSKDRTAY